MGDPVLAIDSLTVEFPQGRGWTPVVDRVSLRIARGETLGLVGESGSGKSMTALSIAGLVPAPGRIAGGDIELDGRSLQGIDKRKWAAIRGGRIGMVFQDAMSGLNPVRTVGSVLVESIVRHQSIGRHQARSIAAEVLGSVGISDADRRLEVHPHQLSGGMRQRVMIALAVVNRPSLIIADEPTTALDATVQAQILDLLKELVADSALLLITHDIGVAAAICDRLAVLYAGRVAEIGEISDVVTQPSHPYTAGLLAAVPTFEHPRRPLTPIEGQPATPFARPSGCAFHPRCAVATERCGHDRPPLDDDGSRAVACWNRLA